ncbi:HD domain-containing protein [Methylobacterium sp. Leaf85]|uniref:HD domain-containing protein n=1 Tax=Methylobacterium sp. Leaf85 TaxID=1736241 RepID=UPI0009EBE8F6|nr:HD domain-containing protein [Methylobacterium sp. Leaf85]
MPKPKSQRLRDPVHNLIEFDNSQFESTLWQVVQTRPFQRLRRIRQLGFSEFVFPGATHTRFAHSIGVFHTARQLMRVIERYVASHDQQFKQQQAQFALAAALLHDVGHGMFSHAFESVGKEFKWPMAKHEDVSQQLIRDSEIGEILNKELGKGYSGNVADIIAQEIPIDLYGSLVSSQFDADRLDYMQRDRLMTGVQSSGVDPTWLLSNLEVAEVPTGSDETSTGTVETLVLGPKAAQTAESYVLALFHLYPNVYLHKATRGAEVVFQAMIRRIVKLTNDGNIDKTGLPINHPIIRFIAEPGNLSRATALDDTVFWGALPMLAESGDEDVRKLAHALSERRLTRCIDVRQHVESELPQKAGEKRDQRQARVKLTCDSVAAALREINIEKYGDSSRIMLDQYVRHPYKRFQDSKTPLNQILIRLGDGRSKDMADLSPIIGNAESFNLCRAYVFRDDVEASEIVWNIMRTKIEECNDA